MTLDKQALFHILKWADVCECENQMNSADFDLAIRIAVQVGNTQMAEEFARLRLHALDREENRRVQNG